MHSIYMYVNKLSGDLYEHVGGSKSALGSISVHFLTAT
jgi:hypothetical protein